jgi:hypothetical protein
MALPIRPAFADTSGTPQTEHFLLNTGQTQLIGAPMKLSSGLATEASSAADAATGLIGFAAAKNQSAFGYDAADSPTTITGRENTIPVHTGTRGNTFYGQISTGTSAIVAPAQADVGIAYGLVKQSDGYWTVNRSDTTNVAVVVTGIDPTLYGTGVVFFKIRNASLAAL